MKGGPMAWLIWFLGLIVFLAVCFFSFGIYEFIVENRQDCKTRDLHLKHLDDINHENK